MFSRIAQKLAFSRDINNFVGIRILFVCRSYDDRIPSGLKVLKNHGVRYMSGAIVVQYFFIPICLSYTCTLVDPSNAAITKSKCFRRYTHFAEAILQTT
jgi:hypothetical protein